MALSWTKWCTVSQARLNKNWEPQRNLKRRVLAFFKLSYIHSTFQLSIDFQAGDTNLGYKTFLNGPRAREWRS